MLPASMRFSWPVFRWMTRPDGGKSAAKASRSSTQKHAVASGPSSNDSPRLLLEFPCVTRPGYGTSTPQPGRKVIDAAFDAARIVDAFGAATFRTIGWSGGGPHALACAAALPGRCLSTVSLAGVAPYPAEGID
jgi:pimeloyl-ACP methyl ester carboxylesterase